MVAKTGVGGGTTVYVGGVYEKNISGPTSEVSYYYANGNRVAMRKDGALSFFAQDHLGGTSLVMNASGQMVNRIRYFPFGNVRTEEYFNGESAPPETDKLFTGQQRESPSGIYYYGARFYNAQLGRFIQPDPIIPTPGNPQALNRYSYVLNNPVRYTDPSGAYPVDAAGEPVIPLDEYQLAMFTPPSHQAVIQAIETLGLPDPQGLLSRCQANCDEKGFDWIMQTYRAARVLERVGDLNMFSWSSGQRSLLVQLGFELEYVFYPTREQTDMYTVAIAVPFAVAGSTLARYLLATTPTYLYQLVDSATGQHLKWGITNYPATRYSAEFMAGKEMRILTSGARPQMLRIERWLTERLPGPLNLESWSGSRRDSIIFPGPW